MANRLARQVQYEFCTHAYKVSNEDWDKTRKCLQRGNWRYKTIPRPDGSRLVITSASSDDLPGDDPGEVLPYGDDDLTNWLEKRIEQAPKGKRITGTQDFGGEQWSGAHAKNEGQYVRFDLSLGDVREGVAALSADIDNWFVTFDDQEGGRLPNGLGVEYLRGLEK